MLQTKLNHTRLLDLGFEPVYDPLLDGFITYEYGHYVRIHPYNNVYGIHIDDDDMDTVASCIVEYVEDVQWLINRYRPEIKLGEDYERDE